MHILESYALQNDLKIDKPFVYENFFPLAVDKFITLDTSSLKTNAMKYDYWQLVVNIISPYLKEQGISIVQLGDKDCTGLEGCYIALGQCSHNQKAYIIKKSLAHLSPNNESCHIASTYNKKSVILFPFNCYPEQFSPYWSDENRVEILQPETVEDRPSYNPNEIPKSINTIAPEKIAQKILNSVGIYSFVPSFKTLKIGNAFNQKRVESDLTHLLDIQKLGVSSLIIRMDLNFNEDALRQQLEACACSIITNRALSDDILDKYSSKILEIVYYLEDDNDPNFIRKVKESSIVFLMRSRKDERSINDLKLAYMDYGMVHRIPPRSQKDFKELAGKNKLYYKSNHFIIHNNSFYTSSAAVRRGIHGTPSMEHEPYEVIDDPLFWEEEDHFQFFEKK
tara:strand:+ start:14357 stop:15541 length:1185 start_codon:yes stop_codon:yes gene_type:complete